MLADRADWVCVPINVHSDLEAYNNFGIELCIQKIMFLMSGLMTSSDSAVYQKASADKARLLEWLNGKNIKMVDEIDTIL